MQPCVSGQASSLRLQGTTRPVISL
jgi:hypothetical protein